MRRLDLRYLRLSFCPFFVLFLIFSFLLLSLPLSPSRFAWGEVYFILSCCHCPATLRLAAGMRFVQFVALLAFFVTLFFLN